MHSEGCSLANFMVDSHMCGCTSYVQHCPQIAVECSGVILRCHKPAPLTACTIATCFMVCTNGSDTSKNPPELCEPRCIGGSCAPHCQRVLLSLHTPAEPKVRQLDFETAPVWCCCSSTTLDAENNRAGASDSGADSPTYSQIRCFLVECSCVQARRQRGWRQSKNCMAHAA
jgi:hypothetical protein